MNPSTVRRARLHWFRRRPARPYPRLRNGPRLWLTRRQLLAYGIGRRRQ